MEPTKPTTNRRYERILMLECPAEVYKLGLLSFLTKTNIGRRLLNVSEVGVQVSTSQQLAIDAKIRIVAKLAQFSDTIEGEFIVRWCTANLHDPAEFFIGAEFTSMPSGQINRIQQLRKASRTETYKQRLDTQRRVKESSMGNLDAFKSDGQTKDPNSSWAE